MSEEDGEKVAAKTAKGKNHKTVSHINLIHSSQTFLDATHMEALLQELKILAHLHNTPNRTSHLNIIRLVGSCTSQVVEKRKRILKVKSSLKKN